eukprot:896002-Pleurochrysis_carterae.AAC.1
MAHLPAGGAPPICPVPLAAAQRHFAGYRQRVHVRDDGTHEVEDHDKPRVTTNSSFGGEDGVNASVAEAERAVELPRVQTLARAAAILDTVAAEDDATDDGRPHLYVVDAESAYTGSARCRGRSGGCNVSCGETARAGRGW